MLTRTQTINWQPLSDKHKAYIRKALSCKMSVAEGSIRSGKTIDNCIIAAAYLERCKDKIHLASGSTIYNEDGNEERLASYVAALCTSKLSADDILNGDCFECDFPCAAGVLNFCAIQAAELREKLIRQEKERLAEKEAYGKRVAHDIFERLIEQTKAVNASDYDGLGVEDLKLMAKEYGVNLEKQADEKGEGE